MKITAIVPVKGNSERVKNKNIRNFSNTNLLALKLTHLKKVNNLDEIVVSSENEEISRGKIISPDNSNSSNITFKDFKPIDSIPP